MRGRNPQRHCGSRPSITDISIRRATRFVSVCQSLANSRLASRHSVKPRVQVTLRRNTSFYRPENCHHNDIVFVQPVADAAAS
jgi:hypothetical protein